MSNNRNFKFPAFLLLIVALFAFGAVAAFASDDLGGGGGRPLPTTSADAQHVFTLNEDVLAQFDAADATLVLLYQPVDVSGIVDSTDLLMATENLLDTDNVGVSLGDWLLETEGGTYRAQLVALIPTV